MRKNKKVALMFKFGRFSLAFSMLNVCIVFPTLSPETKSEEINFLTQTEIRCARYFYILYANKDVNECKGKLPVGRRRGRQI